MQRALGMSPIATVNVVLKKVHVRWVCSMRYAIVLLKIMYIYIYMTWEDMHNMFILIFGEDSLRKQNRAFQIA